jgi:hypothetical protein
MTCGPALIRVMTSGVRMESMDDGGQPCAISCALRSARDLCSFSKKEPVMTPPVRAKRSLWRESAPPRPSSRCLGACRSWRIARWWFSMPTERRRWGSISLAESADDLESEELPSRPRLVHSASHCVVELTNATDGSRDVGSAAVVKVLLGETKEICQRLLFLFDFQLRPSRRKSASSTVIRFANRACL